MGGGLSRACRRASGGWFVSTRTVMSTPGTAFSLSIVRMLLLARCLSCATFCAWSRRRAKAHEVAGGGDRPVVHATVRVKGRPRLLAPAVLGGAEEPFSFFTATWHAILASSGGWRRIALWAGARTVRRRASGCGGD